MTLPIAEPPNGRRVIERSYIRSEDPIRGGEEKSKNFYWNYIYMKVDPWLSGCKSTVPSAPVRPGKGSRRSCTVLVRDQPPGLPRRVPRAFDPGAQVPPWGAPPKMPRAFNNGPGKPGKALAVAGGAQPHRDTPTLALEAMPTNGPGKPGKGPLPPPGRRLGH